mmetsp:Transcript_1671/g.5037  ORF Transcript_1671/g.5037 Transcript_1671/m.5037 type:complete len:337 (-) Transcript_1671:192-1202(-)
MRTAVVGAGVAGAACSSVLAKNGVNVCVFDAGRAVGGRMSTRSVRLGDEAGAANVVEFDYGVAAFEDGAELATRLGDNVVRPWRARTATFGAGSTWMSSGEKTFWIGTPRQVDIVHTLLDGVHIKSQTRVGGVEKFGGGWLVKDEDARSLGVFDAVVLATHPLAVTRMSVPESVRRLAESIEADPLWSLMGTVQGAFGKAWDIGDVDKSVQSKVLRIVVDSNKPDRRTHPVRIVAYSTPEFAAKNLDTPRDRVADVLKTEVEHLLKAKLTTAIAHRWSKAISRSTHLKEDVAYLDKSTMLGIAGDYLGKSPGTVDTAYRSGIHLADCILRASHMKR